MGAKTLRGIMKVINSYEGDQFSKISFKGRGQPYFTKLSPKSSNLTKYREVLVKYSVLITHAEMPL